MSTVLLLFAAVAVTSAAAYLYGSRRHRLTARGLAHAAGILLECAGLTVTFAALNVAAGLALIACTRLTGARFTSLHAVNSSVLVVLSACQAAVYQAWRKSR